MGITVSHLLAGPRHPQRPGSRAAGSRCAGGRPSAGRNRRHPVHRRTAGGGLRCQVSAAGCSCLLAVVGMLRLMGGTLCTDGRWPAATSTEHRTAAACFLLVGGLRQVGAPCAQTACRWPAGALNSEGQSGMGLAGRWMVFGAWPLEKVVSGGTLAADRSVLSCSPVDWARVGVSHTGPCQVGWAARRDTAASCWRTSG